MKPKKQPLLFVLCLLLCSGCSFLQEHTDAKQLKGRISTEYATEQEETEAETEGTPRKEPVEVPTEHPLESEEEDLQPAAPDEMTEILSRMTLEEKVAQLFVVLPEALMDEVSTVTRAGEMTKEAINQIPVGGFIYMQNNLQSPEQVKEMLSNVQSYSMERIGLPAFLCIDEEGGTVARISGAERFGIPGFEDMAAVGQAQDTARAKEIGQVMGGYLSDFGFNIDFAPVADVWSNRQNEVIKNRSFGSDPGLVSDMALSVKEGLEENGVFAVYKHFPGHGMTAGDTHEGYAGTEKTLEEIAQCDLIPFQEGIAAGVSFVMVGHISVPSLTGDLTPASLSGSVIQDLLRERMGYDGIVITDAMNMGALAGQYSSAESAVKALLAGVDLILMPGNLKEAYAGILSAVQDGTVSMSRIDESLERIIRVKLQLRERGMQ